MPERKSFRGTFLDYIPDSPLGSDAYLQGLEWSFEHDEAKVHPIYALLKVTERCASQCVYCGHAGMKDQPNEASTETLTDVLDQLAEVGVVSVNFTGGEPLQRQDLPVLIKHAHDRGLFTVLLTNGSLLRRNAEKLRGTGLDMVIVSVDSVDPEIYRNTRGISLAPVLDGIDALLEWPEDERPTLTTTVVVTAENVHRLDEIVGYFEQRGVGVKFCPYHHYGRWEDDRLSPKDRDVYVSAMGRLGALKRDGAGVINSQAYLDNFAAFNFDERALPPDFRCYCGYTTLYIDPQLNVRSCWSQGLPIAGNLGISRLRDMLNDRKMRRMRAKIRKLDCERCWLLCTAEISLRFSA